jgi:2-polyprenyl-3-methyl-5-hydroxy-6-metoxy-1,4-benzoquinol methylase
MNDEIIKNCPICNSSSFTDLFQCKDQTASKESFPLIKCNQCSLVITSPRPDENSIGKYYESIDYISHSKNSRGILDRIYFIARSIALRNKKKLISRYFNSGKLLDYGCGAGSFLAYVKHSGWQAFGVEPSAKARDIAKESGAVIAASFEELQEGKFDIVTLWHVLEHIHQLNETVEKLKTKLAETGIILIAVPNHESFDATHYKSDWAAYDVPRHLWHFSQQSMSQLLKKHQLKLLETVPMKMDSFYVSILSEKYKKQKGNLAGILKGLSIGLKSNIRANKTRQYSSLIYIAQKE